MVDFRYLGGISDRLAELNDHSERTAVSAVGALVNGTTVFTIAGGSILLTTLICVCVTTNGATPASTLQYSCDPTDGAATTFTGATATLASLAAGGYIVVNGTALTTAPDIVANGAALGPVIARSGIIIPAGIITTTVGVGSTTGTFRHVLRYKPLGSAVAVT